MGLSRTNRSEHYMLDAQQRILRIIESIRGQPQKVMTRVDLRYDDTSYCVHDEGGPHTRIRHVKLK